MSSDQRRDRRKGVSMAAVLTDLDGAIVAGAQTLDVSASGMRLALLKPVVLPSRVMVILSRDGSVRRRGTVMWQRGRQAGIRFDRRYEGANPREPAGDRSERVFVD